MSMIGKQVILKMQDMPHDDVWALVMEENEFGFLKVRLLESDDIGKVITISKYQIKD